MIIGAERKNKIRDDRFGLTADSVNCDGIHLK